VVCLNYTPQKKIESFQRGPKYFGFAVSIFFLLILKDMADTAYCARHIYLVFVVIIEYFKTVIKPLNLEA
jgi:hypothetical protein